MLKQSDIYANTVNGGFKMTVGELIEFLQEAVDESPMLGDKEILMLSEETGSLVGFGGISEHLNSARLFSEDSEEISDE